MVCYCAVMLAHCLQKLTGSHNRSAFEVDTRDLDKPTLKLEVMIDGSAAYQYVNTVAIIWCYD